MSLAMARRQLRSIALGMTALAGLFACEAPYDLAEIEAENAKPIRRTDDLQDLAASSREVVAVGGHGVVVHSLDGGETFRRVNLPGWPDLIDVAACPDGSFAALDFRGRLLTRAADPESDWESRPIPGRDIGLALTCAFDGRIWVVGEFTSVRVSADRGENWSERTFDRDAIFTGIQFVDDQIGFIAGEFGSFLVSVDGGENWTWRPPVDEEFYPQSLVFRSEGEGWLIGLSGTIFRTTDQGETWVRETTPVRSPLFAVALHGQRPVAVGGLGTVLSRGDSWQRESLDPQVFGVLTSVVSLDSGRLLVAGPNGQIRHLTLPAVTAARVDRDDATD